MINNYFLLYHSTNYVLDNDTLLLNFEDDNFCEISALILTIKKEELDSYLELEEFKKLSKKIIINGFLNSSTLYEFCYLVLNKMIKKPDLVLSYIDVFNYLHSKSLINEKNYSKLVTVFKPLSLDTLHVDKKKNDFIQNKDILFSNIEKAKTLFESTSLIEDLSNLEKYIHNQIFSIGITGVMNVGKSTLINALLSKELLGTSVVAETANLSVIKYSKKAYTKVRFFNKNEFNEMLHAFSDKSEQDEYLKSIESSLHVEKYVQEKSLVIDIERNELHRYTSASDSSGFSHIVKDVELGVDLDFLKDAIEIVDTPGLDDSLIVRESVTQGYVANCDLLIHLMNVNQSATQKDIDFIIDAVLNQNVTSMLVLLTKADNISKKDLQEVIKYTKNSIQNQLSSINDETKALKILESLQFLSVSAKTALDVNKRKQSGIVEVEDYLHNSLFSKSSKNEQIIDTSSRKFIDIIKSQIKIYHYNLVLYSKDEGALEDELRSFNITKEQNNNIYKKIDTQIKSEYKEFKVFLNNLTQHMDSDISELKSKLMSRVFDEILYSLNKENATLKDMQLKMIIDKSLNHGFIDIVREHKYKLSKKVESISKNIELSFDANNIKVDDLEDKFSMQKLFEKNSNSTLTTASKLILKQTLILTKSITLSKIKNFKDEYTVVLDEEFTYVKTHLEDTLDELNILLSKTFFDTLRVPIERLKEELVEYEDSLEKQIFLMRDKDKDIQELQIDTQSKINLLESMMESLS